MSNTQSSSQQHMASGTGDSSTDVILDLFNNIRLAQGVQPQTEQLTSLDVPSPPPPPPPPPRARRAKPNTSRK